MIRSQTIKKMLLAACLLVIPVWSALAQTTGDEVGLTARALDAPESSLPTYLLWALVGMLVLMAMASIWNAVWKSPPDHLLGYLAAAAEGPVARRLFLPLRYRKLSRRSRGGSEGHDSEGYLRSLGTREASALVRQEFHKGDQVVLHLGSVPGFPDANLDLQATVVRTRKRLLNGQWREIRMRVHPGGEEVRKKVAGFIACLAPAGPGGADAPVS